MIAASVAAPAVVDHVATVESTDVVRVVTRRVDLVQAASSLHSTVRIVVASVVVVAPLQLRLRMAEMICGVRAMSILLLLPARGDEECLDVIPRLR